MQVKNLPHLPPNFRCITGQENTCIALGTRCFLKGLVWIALGIGVVAVVCREVQLLSCHFRTGKAQALAFARQLPPLAVVICLGETEACLASLGKSAAIRW